MSSGEQAEGRVLGWGRCLAAGVVVGVVVGVVLAAADPVCLALYGKTDRDTLLQQVSFSVAVLVPFFLAAGVVGAVLLRVARGISPALFRTGVWLTLLTWVAVVFGHVTTSRVGSVLTIRRIPVMKDILTIVTAAGLTYAVLYGLATLLVRQAVRKRTVRWLLAGALLWAAAVAVTVVAETRPELPGKVAPTTAEKPNVLLIVLDTVRADHLGCYGYHRETTPNIDEFATGARVYRNVLCPSPWTLPTHASFFTGLPGSAHGVRHTHQMLDARFDTLAEKLRDAGYQTVGLSSNEIVDHSRSFDQGFEFYEIPVLGRTGHRARMVAELLVQVLFHHRDSAAGAMHQRLRHWFENVYRPDKPFFLFLNYIEPHAPYVPASHVLEWTTPDVAAKWEHRDHQDMMHAYTLARLASLSSKDIGELEALYDEEIRFTDRKVGELLDFLHTNGLDENALIIVTSDHGEHFGEHHKMGHQYSLYEPLVRVPLIVRMKGTFTPGEDHRLVQSQDVYPTILESAGVAWERTPAHNCESLLRTQTSPERRGIAEHLSPSPGRVGTYSGRFPILDFDSLLRKLRAVQVGHMKLIQPSEGEAELYDLDADPFEAHDLANERPDDVRRLRKQLTDWLQSFQHYEAPELTPEELKKLSPKSLDDLRGLGYVK